MRPVWRTCNAQSAADRRQACTVRKPADHGRRCRQVRSTMPHVPQRTSPGRRAGPVVL